MADTLFEETTERPAPTPRSDPSSDAAGWRRSPWLAGLLVALGAVGVALVLTVLIGLVWAQLAVFAVSCVALYSGVSTLGRRLFGPGFDLGAWLCAGWLAVLVIGAVCAPLLPLATHIDLAGALDEPALERPGVLPEHPLGTNNFGLDMLARTLYGARASLVVALGAVLIGLVLGGAIGILAGYFGRAVDSVVGVATNSLLAVPPLILLIALATVLEPSLGNIALALALPALPSMIRMARASTLGFAQREFVLAAESMGASRRKVILRELVPNVLLPLASYAMVMVSVLIVAEASLSFLGLGVQPPAPSWGNMIAEGEGDQFLQHPHLVLVPGVALFLTVFSFNLLGEKARKRWDPRRAKL